ncbi:MAG: aldo/keto reductase [Fidelibacterota bacterium]
MDKLKIDTKISLNNGVEMPLFGLGTFQSPRGKIVQDAVQCALKTGYRLIDTAKIYGNEKDVGISIRNSGIPREEIFVTTKLWNSDHGYDSAIAACRTSLKSLGLDFVDLYLIHWPVEGLRLESWRALETLYDEGKCRSIGVSNYMIGHLEELLEFCHVIPAVNQIEFSPYLYLTELLEFCQDQNIQLEAYSPLTKGRKLEDSQLITIADKYSKSTAQILIRWVLQKGVVVIPKSSHKERIVENSEVFDFSISPGDMLQLDSFNENLRTAWDPSNVR